jgi:hypothetical protein
VINRPIGQPPRHWPGRQLGRPIGALLGRFGLHGFLAAWRAVPAREVGHGRFVAATVADLGGRLGLLCPARKRRADPAQRAAAARGSGGGGA